MSILVVLIVVGVLQLALALHVRNMLASAAHEGARRAAAYDATVEDGAARAESMVASALGGYDADVTVSVTKVGGADAVSVVISGPVPVFGLWGVGEVTAQSTALKETHRGGR